MRRPLLALLALAPAPAGAAAQEADSASRTSIYAELRLVSRYVWRGYDLSRGKPALQPWVEAFLPNGLSFNFFTTAALDRQTELDEFQIGALYGRDLGAGLSLVGGYLAYLQPGTETEPTGEEPGSELEFNRSGEFVLSLTRSWEGGYAALTYSRGHGSGEGNSVNLWLEHELALGEAWTLTPYLQADYLDEYGPPRRLGERVSGIEIGAPLRLSLGGWAVEAAGYLTHVPSGYVRASNGESGGSSRALQPWAAIAVVLERD
jgi:hypothetical protein